MMKRLVLSAAVACLLAISGAAARQFRPSQSEAINQTLNVDGRERTSQAENMEEKQDNVVAQELRRLGRRWVNAIVRRDRTAFGALLADDVIVTNSDGKVLSKAEEIADKAPAGYVHNVGYGIRVNETRVYGETAVMTGTYTKRLDYRSHGGQVWRLSQRFTFVWVKRGRLWQIVAAQFTVVAEG
jgi:ketosteroid isomerase-like protein